MKFNRIKGQSGFTLIELLVGLAILTLLAVTVSGAFDGSRSRAQALVSAMAEVGNANIRLKNDTGCYVNRPDGLTMPVVGKAAASNYCARDFTKTWNGPYLNKLAIAANGSVKMDNISSDVEVSLGKGLGSGGAGNRYFTHAINLPSDVVKRALQECNNDTTESVADSEFDTKKCRGTSGTGGDGVFDMVYDETR
jgi:prepilin-type N-terminal cleavage/methylation domain-containing protein